MIAQCREVLPIHPLSEEAMIDELKKLYEQVDELRAKATRDGRHDLTAAYSRVLGLINNMLAGREDAVVAGIDCRSELAAEISLNELESNGRYLLSLDQSQRDTILSALRSTQPTPTHHYTAAEIEDRLTTAGSHPHGDARDLQMLRQVCRTLAEKELLITSAAATLHSMYEVGIDGSAPWWGEDFLVSLRQFQEAGYCPYPSAEATSHDPS